MDDKQAPKVRAKFKLEFVKDEEGGLKTLRFGTVYSPDPSHENYSFWKATPSGHLVMGVINPEAAAKFEVGKEYYLDFTPAD